MFCFKAGSANFGPISPKFEPVSVKSSIPKLGQVQLMTAETNQSFGKFRRNLDRCRKNVGRHGQISGKDGPISTYVGRSPATLGRIWAEVDQFWADAGKVDRNWVDVSQAWPTAKAKVGASVGQL